MKVKTTVKAGVNMYTTRPNHNQTRAAAPRRLKSKTKVRAIGNC